MHPNPSFRGTPAKQNLDFARSRSFGILSVNGDNGPVLAHVPFLLSGDGGHANLHLARSNALVQATAGAKAVLAVGGPDAYISPDWYDVVDQVPTWNYIAVHLRGVLHQLPQDALEPHLTELSARFEQRLLPKPVWKPSKMGEGVMDRMMRMVLPFRLTITAVDGTWKLNQNKPVNARQGVIAVLEAQGGTAAEVARAMAAVAPN